MTNKIMLLTGLADIFSFSSNDFRDFHSALLAVIPDSVWGGLYWKMGGSGIRAAARN